MLTLLKQYHKVSLVASDGNKRYRHKNTTKQKDLKLRTRLLERHLRHWHSLLSSMETRKWNIAYRLYRIKRLKKYTRNGKKKFWASLRLVKRKQTKNKNKKNMPMEEEAYLLPQLDKVPSGDDVAQDCRLHVGSEERARAFDGCPVRRWHTACGAVGQRKRAPNMISSSLGVGSVPTFLERAVPSTAKVTRNVWHKSQALRPESGDSKVPGCICPKQAREQHRRLPGRSTKLACRAKWAPNTISSSYGLGTTFLERSVSSTAKVISPRPGRRGDGVDPGCILSLLKTSQVELGIVDWFAWPSSV